MGILIDRARNWPYNTGNSPGKAVTDVKRDYRLGALYLFYGMNFIATGMTTFAPKYYGEIGLSDGQIGLISAVLALVALFAQPAWGMLADRARYKRTVVAVALAGAGLTCFLVPGAAGRFVPLLLVLTLYNTLYVPAMPVGNAIAIEYTAANGRSFGPVRMMGTIGYQVGILATGFLLANSLRGLYPAMGAMLLLAAGSALLLPPVQGHQHSREKLSFAPFLHDRALLLLLAAAFIGHIGHQFNLVFFSKRLGDLGVSNSVTGLINTFSVILEIPFLMLGDRIMKRFSIWAWLLIGMGVGAVRFLLMAVLRAPLPIVLVQMLSIAHLACFEFFPFIHLGRVARKELQASAQSLYQMVTFCLARIVASLAGGIVADALGIPAVYALCGGLMAAATIGLWGPMRRRMREEAEG